MNAIESHKVRIIQNSAYCALAHTPPRLTWYGSKTSRRPIRPKIALRGNAPKVMKPLITSGEGSPIQLVLILCGEGPNSLCSFYPTRIERKKSFRNFNLHQAYSLK